MQDSGFNSFASNMIKLSVSETKWSSFLARTRALILYISIWIFDFGPEKLLDCEQSLKQETEGRLPLSSFPLGHFALSSPAELRLDWLKRGCEQSKKLPGLSRNGPQDQSIVSLRLAKVLAGEFITGESFSTLFKNGLKVSRCLPSQCGIRHRANRNKWTCTNSHKENNIDCHDSFKANSSKIHRTRKLPATKAARKSALTTSSVKKKKRVVIDPEQWLSEKSAVIRNLLNLVLIRNESTVSESCPRNRPGFQDRIAL